MSKLFREQYYNEIVSALSLLEDPSMEAEAEKIFTTTCRSAQLNSKEIEWLWNYLKNYNKEKADWKMRSQMPPW